MVGDDAQMFNASDDLNRARSSCDCAPWGDGGSEDAPGCFMPCRLIDSGPCPCNMTPLSDDRLRINRAGAFRFCSW